MLHPMNFQMPTDEEIHTAFTQGEAAVMALFHGVAAQVTALAQQLVKQGAMLQELQARLGKSSRNSSQPPSSDGYGKVRRTASLRKAGDKPNGASRAMRARRSWPRSTRIGSRPMPCPAVRIARRPEPLSQRRGMRSATCSIAQPYGSPSRRIAPRSRFARRVAV